MLTDYTGEPSRLKLKRNEMGGKSNGTVQKKINKPVIKEHPLFEQVMEKFDGEILRS